MDRYLRVENFIFNNSSIVYAVVMLVIIGLQVDNALEARREASLVKLGFKGVSDDVKDMISQFFQCVMQACGIQFVMYGLMIMGQTRLMKWAMFLACANIVLIDAFGYKAGSEIIHDIHNYQKERMYAIRYQHNIEKLVIYELKENHFIVCPLYFNDSVADVYPFARYIQHQIDFYFEFDSGDCVSDIYGFFFDCGRHVFKYTFFITLLQVLAFYLNVKMVKLSKNHLRDIAYF